MKEETAYIPGRAPSAPGPLSRFLPPLPRGVARAWLELNLPRGTWVVDPFGAAPQFAVEGAQSGYRVLVAANNPIARLLLEMFANPPSEALMRSALADLAATHKGDERLEPHIKSLYITECAACKSAIQASYFLWERQAPGPYARFYQCKHCGDSGERPATAADLKRAQHFPARGLHHARALERVAALNDPDRVHAEEALEVYPPRAVYALFTLINKMEGLQLAPDKRLCLSALLLAACDQANTLWAHPTNRERPRQLSISPRFREYNVWTALEQAIGLWVHPNPEIKGIPITSWPVLPPDTGGICMFEGRLKDLASQEQQIELKAALAAFPRPNQAFWTLSALWAGWIWGREAVGPFRSVLRRRRYDWGWHTTALSAALENLAGILPNQSLFFGLIPEPEPGFISSAMISAEKAGFELEHVALRTGDGQAQISWRNAQGKGGQGEGASPALSERQAVETARQAVKSYLEARGQPSTYLPAYTAAMRALAQQHAFALEPKPADPDTLEEVNAAERFSHVNNLVKDIFSFRSGLLRYEGTELSLETGQWWLRDAEEACQPISDRIEVEFVRYLQKHPGCQLGEIDTALCAQFPGLLTPDPQLLEACLESYGEQEPAQSGRWQLRPPDSPASRRRDLELTRGMVTELGERLGFQVHKLASGDPSQPVTSIPYAWQDQAETVQYLFYVLASAAFGGFLFSSAAPVKEITGEAQSGKPNPGVKIRPVILLPGSRSNLVAYKLRNDPHLRHEVDKGWMIIKYRHLRRMLESTTLTRENLDEQLALDPVTDTAPQMRLL